MGNKKHPFKIQELIDQRDIIIRASNDKILKAAMNEYPAGLEITVLMPEGIKDMKVAGVQIGMINSLLIVVEDEKGQHTISSPEKIHPKDRAHGKTSYLSDVATWGIEGE